MRGFTLVEIVIVLVLAGLVVAYAVPAYERYLERTRVVETTVGIGTIQKSIRNYEIAKGKLPDGLADVDYDGARDPWGRSYEYLNLRNLKGNGKARKDKSLAPLNSDYDLYSVGADGISAAQLSNKASRDDIVRARDGRFVGLASEFDP